MFKVFQPTTIGQLELRNRFIRSATNDSTAEVNGAITDESVKINETVAAGGVGLLVTGHAYVADNGKAGGGQYGIHCDEMIPGLARIAKAVHKHGALIAAGLLHAGLASMYLSQSGQLALAPSLREGRQPHRAMTEEDIDAVMDDFAAAAVRAQDAGFDAVQVQGAHGYLLSQFLSPLTNQRQDRWGGSPENRWRMHVETIRRIRRAVGGEFPILMKFGVMDDRDGGTSLEEGIAAINAMAEVGLDAVEISGGIAPGSLGAIRAIGENVSEDTYYRERAARVKRAIDIPLAVVGGIRLLETAEDIVMSGDADFVCLCRPLLREPGLIQRWLSGDHRRAKCITCNKCTAAMYRRSGPIECEVEREIRGG